MFADNDGGKEDGVELSGLDDVLEDDGEARAD